MGKKREIPKQTVLEMQAMKRRGSTLREIADRFGVSRAVAFEQCKFIVPDVFRCGHPRTTENTRNRETGGCKVCNAAGASERWKLWKKQGKRAKKIKQLFVTNSDSHRLLTMQWAAPVGEAE